MGIYDRDYMRNENDRRGWGAGWFAGTPAIVWVFIVVNIAVFFLQTGFRDTWGFTYPEAADVAAIVEAAAGPEEARRVTDEIFRRETQRTGGVSVDALTAGNYWTLLTHQFVNVSIFHLVFCLVVLFFTGREVVRGMGSIPFMLAYILGGAFGALPILSVQLLPQIDPVSHLGATASVSAVFGYLAMAMPDRRLQFLVFALPIRSGIRRLAHFWAMANIGLFVLGFAFPSLGIGWAANFAGTLLGLGLGKVLKPGARAPRKPKVQSYRKRDDNPNIIETEFVDAKTDYNEILDKINREGIGALSEEEKKTLEQASDDLRKRP